MPRKIARHITDEQVQPYIALVKYLASKLYNRIPRKISFLDNDDLTSLGMIGLMRSVKSYDPKYKNKFVTFAKHRIKGEMLDGLRNIDHLSRGHRKDVTSGKSIDPLYHPLKSLTNDGLYYDEDSTREPPDPRAIDPSVELVQRERLSLLYKCTEQLPTRNQTVICLLIWNELTLVDIACKLQISPGRASQIKTESIKRLRAMMMPNK